MKRLVLRIGGQDETGLKDISVRENNIATPISFTRTGVGIFDINGFDPNKHCIDFRPYFITGKAIWSSEDNTMQTLDSNINSDFVFEFGGYIIIEEFNYELV